MVQFQMNAYSINKQANCIHCIAIIHYPIGSRVGICNKR